MANLQALRGMRDLIGDESRRYRQIFETAAQVAERFAFEEIETPILEPSSVFLRTLGETSDVVHKQMYVFKDRGDDEIALRPEGTAGVARAFISEGLSQNLPLKLYYRGPMFRYERPQKGRYRQFYQFGVELLGVDSVQADCETISMAWQTLGALGLQSQTQLQLNTIGDSQSRSQYRQAFVDYLKPFFSKLSEDSRMRFEKNPLRILDSKDEGDRELLRAAPIFGDFLNEESKQFFARLCQGLKDLEIPFQLDQQLVRGLDYYCHTVFEFTTTSVGSQNAIIAGGRYDGLIESMGGPKTPGVGWAAGVDRMAMMLTELRARPAVFSLVPAGEAAERRIQKLAFELRERGFTVDVGFSGNIGKRLKRADKIGARAALILGDEELQKQVITLKDLQSGQQSQVSLNDVATALKRLLGETHV